MSRPEPVPRTARPGRRPIGTGEGQPPSPLSAAVELAALGAGLTLALWLAARLPHWRQDLGAFQSLFLIAGGFYLLAVTRLGRWAALPRAGHVVFAVALATRLALLPVTPTLSDDLYRYVWEGRVLLHGGNPYAQPPLDPALAALRDRSIFPHLNHPQLATIYPPLAEAGFALVAALSPTVTAMKLWVILHDLALVATLLALLARSGAPAAAALVYAWNPLVLIEYAGSGHHEPTALLWLALALRFARSRPALSALALATGTLVKLAPLAALPFLWRDWNVRARALAVIAVAVGLGGYAFLTRDPASGLHAYWSTWRNNQLVFEYLERGTGRFESARAIAIATVSGVLALAWWKRHDAARALRQVFRAGFLLGPVAHPWYLGWVLALEPARPSAPWLLLSLTAILNYGLFRAPLEGGAWHLPLAVRWVEYGVPAVLGLLLWARRARAGPG